MSAPVGVVEALSELVDLMQGVIDGEYKPDSFTLQPARAALAQQPAADPLVEWANSPLNYTATVGVFKDGVQPAAVEGVEAALQKWLDWCNEYDEEPEAKSGARIAIEALAQQPAACPKCGGTGEADSGGIMPWGAPAMILCECQPPAADDVDAEQFRKGWQAGFAEGRRDQQPAACVACEGAPGSENTPCAVCGQQPAAVDGADAKDAEIERLRAEVEAAWAAMPRDARYLDPPDGGCVPLHEQVRRMAADATRAERLEAEREVIVAEAVKYAGKSGRLEAKVDRLAEALRLARDLVEDWAGYAGEYFQKKHNLEGDLALLDAALRDQGDDSGSQEQSE